MDKLKLIKGIVFVLTFLLIFGSLTILGHIFRQTRSKPLPAEVSLQQPAGSSIEKIIANDGQLYILVRGGGLSDRVLIFNTQGKQPLTTLQLD